MAELLEKERKELEKSWKLLHDQKTELERQLEDLNKKIQMTRGAFIQVNSFQENLTANFGEEVLTLGENKKEPSLDELEPEPKDLDQDKFTEKDVEFPDLAHDPGIDKNENDRPKEEGNPEEIIPEIPEPNEDDNLTIKSKVKPQE